MQSSIIKPNIKSKFNLIPGYILSELVFLLDYQNAINLLLLNQETLNILLPFCYRHCIIDILYKDRYIRFEKYGKLIKNLKIILHEFDKLSNSFVDEVNLYLNPNCNIKLHFSSRINFESFKNLAKFNIDEVIISELTWSPSVQQFDDPEFNFSKFNFLKNTFKFKSCEEVIAESGINGLLSSYFERLSPSRIKTLGEFLSLEFHLIYLDQFKNLTYLTLITDAISIRVGFLIQLFYPNLMIFYLKIPYDDELGIPHCEIDSKNFPKLKVLGLSINFDFTFINEFDNLKEVHLFLDEKYDKPLNSINIPKCKALRHLILPTFNTRKRSEVQILPNITALEESLSKFSNLTFFYSDMYTLTLPYLKFILMLPKLKILSLDWLRHSRELYNWIRRKPKIPQLSLEYIHLNTPHLFISLTKLLVDNSPNLIKVCDYYMEEHPEASLIPQLKRFNPFDFSYFYC